MTQDQDAARKAEGRYFYHSFPRRGRDDPRISTAKGLRILSNIAKHGLLLTPDVVEWTEYLQDGTQSKPVIAVQCRVCFTELTPAELADHSQAFGSFALEFDIDTLRDLGGIPVFYVPKAAGPEKGFKGAAATLLCRIAEVQHFLSRLEELQKLILENPKAASITLTAQRDGKLLSQVSVPLEVVDRVFGHLMYDMRPVPELVGAIKALGNFFYPTDDPRYTDTLGYYRQREWRIISSMLHRGKPACRTMLVEEAADLCGLDSEFFDKQISFPFGVRRRVDECQVLPAIDGKPLLGYVRRVIVPAPCLKEAEDILRMSNLATEITSLESLS